MSRNEDLPPNPVPSHHAHGFWSRRVASFIHWLHIYLSTASFALLLFFAITGLTLNHADWFSSRQTTAQYRGQMDRKWLQTPGAAGVARLEIVEHLRRTHAVKAPVSDFRLEDAQCAVSFRGPGYTADGFVNRTTGEYEMTETRLGLAALLNDLHKGRDTGRGWSLVIDLAAVLMTVASLTGLLLIWFVKRRRWTALLVAAAGAVLSGLAYRWLIP
jgi:uncharacterized protein